ncbi:MAG: flagellar protein FlgN [Myxococcota bacterium]|jgi:flagellar biosynthesis/type III secretory pathway chaperone|nr:flagellar protein FlgN [Myxococcota bacterium]
MTETAAIVRRLLSILSEEERLYVELKSLLQEEHARMVARDADAIEQIVAQKDALASEGRLLEECRSKVMKELGRAFGLAESETTLSRLCAVLGEEGAELRASHGRIVALVAAVRELLDANANFAGEALFRVQSTLRLLGRLLPDQPTYERNPTPTSMQPVARPGRLVQQAV